MIRLSIPPHPNEGDSEYKVKEFKVNIEKGGPGHKNTTDDAEIECVFDCKFFVMIYLFIYFLFISLFFFLPQQKIEDLEKDIKVLKEIGKFFV